MTQGQRTGSDFVASFEGDFPYVLTSTLAILGTACEYEGFDQWIYVTYAALADELRKDITQVFGPLGVSLILRRLVAESPDLPDLTSFVGWLSLMDDGLVREHVACGLTEMAAKTEAGAEAAPPLDDEAAIRHFLTEVSTCGWTETSHKDPAYFDQIVRLLGSPEQLKARLVFTVTRFWEAHYGKEYEETRRLIDRNVTRHRQLARSQDLTDLYLRVTGKPMTAGSLKKYSKLERVLFLPTCYSGAYVSLVPLDSNHRSLALIYNCRPQSGNGTAQDQALPSLFPPLKALADETRLEILSILADGELYAQQIVDRLEISQPAVSRHLKLMVTVGLLAERKENGMKFYRVREETLSDMARRIATLAARGSDEA